MHKPVHITTCKLTFVIRFRVGLLPSFSNMYDKFHALNISQKFKVTEPEVLQSGTLNYSKLVRILECACSLFKYFTSFSYTARHSHSGYILDN